MKIKMYQVDAFTQELFGGNPAAICLLEKWLPESKMQQIAAENNLAETAFIVQVEDVFDIRWFTPVIEVDLCGHATLAAAHVIFNHLQFTDNEIEFRSMHSGVLKVTRSGNMLTLDFPADTFVKIPTPPNLSKALGMEPMETYKGKTDFMAVLPSEQHVLNLSPDFDKLALLNVRGVIVTATGTVTDFVSRFFSPVSGINEDPVTGSAHTTLTPYWSKELGKKDLVAAQLSARKGKLWCKQNGNRVAISGHAVTYLTGEIQIN